MTDRLPTAILVEAALHRASQDGHGAYLIRKGDRVAGGLLVKIARDRMACRVINRSMDFDGNLVWLDAFDPAEVPEPEADAYIERALARDPDLWAVAFDRPDGLNPFEDDDL